MNRATTVIAFIILLLIHIKGVGQEPRLVVPVGHTGPITNSIFSPDGKRIVTVSEDGTSKIWDVQSGKLLADLKGHKSTVWAAAFSPDTKKIATVSSDGTIKIWDAQSGSLFLDIKAHFGEIRSVCFSTDGKRILTAGVWDHLVKVWDTFTGQQTLSLTGHKGHIWKATFSPDGQKILSVSDDKSAKLWSSETGELLADLKDHVSNVRYAEFSPDGKRILTVATFYGGVKIWDTESGAFLSNLKEKLYEVRSAHFSPDGNKIVTSAFWTGDSTIKIWEAQTGKLIGVLQAGESLVNSTEFSRNGNEVICAFASGTVRLWNINDKKLVAEYRQAGRVLNAQFSPDGNKIFTSSSDGSARIRKIRTGELIADLRGHSDMILSAEFSPDGKTIITALEKKIVNEWDVQTGTLGAVFDWFRLGLRFARVAPFKKELLTFSWSDGTAKTWDLQNGKILAEFIGHQDAISTATFSPDGKQIVTGSWDKTARTWDTETGILQVKFEGHSDKLTAASFSNDQTKIVTASFDGTVKIWDTRTGEQLLTIGKNPNAYYFAQFSPDGNKLVTGSMGVWWQDTTIKVWETQTGKLLFGIPNYPQTVNMVQFSPDGKSILTASEDHTAKIWDARTGSLLFNLKGHSRKVGSAVFSPDGKRVLTKAEDNTCKLWNAKNGELLYTFFALDNVDHFSQTSVGYYRSTPAASKLLHYVTKDLKVITFEQLDVKYNRPDKVLEAIGNPDTALIRSYRKAWEKRIKKLGIDTTQFRDGYSVPEADFSNRDTIEYEQKNEMLSLHIKGKDSTYKLDRFNVWVNESPLFGQRGINIRKKNSNSIDTTIIIKLSQGENRIETSITNVNGTESYRMPLTVNYTPAVQQKETLRFIGIGIDKFADSQYNLQYSSKDIRDLAKKLKEKYGNDITIDTLFNENVTTTNVASLKKKLQQTTVNDKVIISYSGHGMLSKEFDYFLSTYSVNFNKPEENGLPYDELENLLDSIPARKKLLLIDACHSGEVDKEELQVINKASDSLKLLKGLKPVGYADESHLGLKNSFELMQNLFVNVGKSTGATIISAAAGTQFALERNDLKNGVFTYSILEAMQKNPTIKISELKKIVGERVEQLTNGLQKPTSRNETIAVDWTLW